MDRHLVARPERLRWGLPVHIRLSEGFHPVLKRCAERFSDLLLFDQPVEFAQKRPDISDNPQIHGAIPSDLLRLDVGLDEFRILAEDIAEQVEEAEPASEKENQIGAGEGGQRCAGADCQ